jgi:hypothetical protein
MDFEPGGKNPDGETHHRMEDVMDGDLQRRQ